MGDVLRGCTGGTAQMTSAERFAFESHGRSPVRSSNQGSKLRELLPPMAVAALLRLGLMLGALLRTGTRVMTQGDTRSYLEPGRNLFTHGAFVAGSTVEIDRTPGYPVFIMLSGMLFNNVLLSIVVQIAISVSSLMLVTRIADLTFPAARLGSRAGARVGVIAAWLFAVEPISTIYSVRLMPETLFLFLLLVMVERVLTYFEENNIRFLVMTGGALAAATYVRPVTYYLAPAMAIGLLCVSYKWKGKCVKASCVLLGVTIPLLAAWQFRNWIETGYSGFSSVVDKNLYFYQAAGIRAKLDHVLLTTEQALLGYDDDAAYLKIHPEQIVWGQAQRLHFMRASALETVRNHPWITLESQMAGVGVVAFTPCAMELSELLDISPGISGRPRRVLSEGMLQSFVSVAQGSPAVALIMVSFETYLILLYAFSVYGCIKVKAAKGALPVLVGIGMYFLLISGGAQAVGRYRLPLMPLLCVLAAGGIVKWAKTNAGPRMAPQAE